MPKNPVVEEKLAFCCPGCHVVYQILSAQNQLDGHFSDHPIFTQAVKAGLISNPELLAQIKKNKQQCEEIEKEKLHLEIGNMWCPSCAEIIRLILLQVKGVVNCVVDYSTDLASIEFAPRYVSKDEILKKIRSFGYEPELLQNSERKALSLSLYLRFIVAAFFTLNIMMFSYPLYAPYFDGQAHTFQAPFAWLSFFLSLPVLGYSAYPIIRRFLTSLQVGVYGMETLVVIAVFSAFSLSFCELVRGGTHVYFDSMSVVVTLVLLGKILEAKGKFTAKEALLRLTMALPRRGRKKMGSEAKFVPIKEIKPGDEVVVFSGEKIVLDGEVLTGEGLCDEALMTGESIPIRKQVGSSVIGGSLLMNGALTLKVTRPAEESALQRIVEMVERDIGHKTAYIRAVDPIVRLFVPCVLAFAIFIGLTFHSFQTFLSILLISCPCAIGIAAPLAESHLLNRLANLGAIVRNRGCLALLGKETAFVFDKTGTITEGRFQVQGGLSTPYQRELKGLASQSNHPIARAIAEEILEEAHPFASTEEIPGKGMRGICNEEIYFLGSKTFLEEQGIACPEPENQTTVFFGKGSSCLETLVLSDAIKKEAKPLVGGLRNTILLSGDGKEVVEAVAKECHFDSFRFGQSPLEKRAFIEELSKKHVVCMVGDGINDAPALTAAHIGISVVTASDISIQVSDLLFTTDDLSILPKIRSLASFTRRIINQNLFWAFFYNVIGMGLAACGCLVPIFSAAAMVLSSVIVLFNARRISSNRF